MWYLSQGRPSQGENKDPSETSKPLFFNDYTHGEAYSNFTPLQKERDGKEKLLRIF